MVEEVVSTHLLELDSTVVMELTETINNEHTQWMIIQLLPIGTIETTINML